MIEYADFEKVDMRVGRIVAVEDFPEARRPAWKLRIDFGPELGEKRSSAQITNYAREELEGRLVVAVVNFPPRQIGPVRSEVLVLGAVADDHPCCCSSPTPGRSPATASPDRRCVSGPRRRRGSTRCRRSGALELQAVALPARGAPGGRLRRRAAGARHDLRGALGLARRCDGVGSRRAASASAGGAGATIGGAVTGSAGAATPPVCAGGPGAPVSVVLSLSSWTGARPRLGRAGQVAVAAGSVAAHGDRGRGAGSRRRGLLRIRLGLGLGDRRDRRSGLHGAHGLLRGGHDLRLGGAPRERGARAPRWRPPGWAASSARA